MMLSLLLLIWSHEFNNSLPLEVNYLVQSLPQDAATKEKILKLDNLLRYMPDAGRNDFLRTSIYRYTIDQYDRVNERQSEIEKIHLDDEDPFLKWFVSNIFDEWKILQSSPYYKLVKDNIPVTSSVEAAGYMAVKNKYILFSTLKFPTDELSLIQLKKSFKTLEIKLLEELLGKISVYLSFIGKEVSPSDDLVFFSHNLMLPEPEPRELASDEPPPEPTNDWLDKNYSEPLAAEVNTWLDKTEPEPVNPTISSWNEGNIPPIANHRILPNAVEDWLDDDFFPTPTDEWHDKNSRLESLTQTKEYQPSSNIESVTEIDYFASEQESDEISKNRPKFGKDPDSDKIINL